MGFQISGSSRQEFINNSSFRRLYQLLSRVVGNAKFRGFLTYHLPGGRRGIAARGRSCRRPEIRAGRITGKMSDARTKAAGEDNVGTKRTHQRSTPTNSTLMLCAQMPTIAVFAGDSGPAHDSNMAMTKTSGADRGSLELSPNPYRATTAVNYNTSSIKAGLDDIGQFHNKHHGAGSMFVRFVSRQSADLVGSADNIKPGIGDL